ncbi:hypothetical protein LOK49_LG01G03349 [Camellia lanceoleosa]|uniref:Uncharacterized protein n=1 Tax=Camellia lanceoleosa TaxID=1840588 RepID=A0ACC0J5W8_9ERIC|nr:hypothetical protein LOK49_LG01G03349 [Camellia lanceoleosa]
MEPPSAQTMTQESGQDKIVDDCCSCCYDCTDGCVDFFCCY